MKNSNPGPGGRISAAGSAALSQGPKSLGQRMLDNWQLYALLIIPVVLTVVYKYIPMYGIQIAFRDFAPGLGFSTSPWVGFNWFTRFFKAPTFSRMIKNTVLISETTLQLDRLKKLIFEE